MSSTGERVMYMPGRHLIAELYDCDQTSLTDSSRINVLLQRAAKTAGVRVLDTLVHSFPGGGVTGLCLLAESHLSIHTWPEHRYAAVDMFTCGAGLLDEVALIFKVGLASRLLTHHIILRGEALPEHCEPRPSRVMFKGC